MALLLHYTTTKQQELYFIHITIFTRKSIHQSSNKYAGFPYKLTYSFPMHPFSKVNLKGFLMFSVLEKGCIVNEWVKLSTFLEMLRQFRTRILS